MKKNEMRRSIFVFADWAELNEPQLMGLLHSELLRGKEVFSFEYEANWLRSTFAQVLDPDLALYTGLHYLNDEKTIFGYLENPRSDRS